MVPEMNTSMVDGPVPWESLFPLVGVAPANCSQEEALALPTFSAAAQARVVITLLLCVFSTACNVAVLWAGVGRSHAKRSHARVLLLHLAGADLLVALVVMPLDAAWNITVQWRAGDMACRLLMFLKLLAMYASAFVTALISLDRQGAILHPLAFAEAGQRSQVLLQAAWLLSVALSVPQLFLFHTITISAPQNFTQCTTRGSFAQRWHETAYNMLTFSCLFLLPLLIMLSCYSRILLEIFYRTGSTSTLSAMELPLRRSRNPIPQARLRMLRLSVAIVCSFVVCWTPYYLLGLWYWFWPAAMESQVSHSLAHLLFIFGLLNACLDPVIYGLFTMPWPWRLRGCCAEDGPGLQPQPSSSVTGSFHCSASTVCDRRGTSHLGLVEAARPPSVWTKGPIHGSCL
ncbi:gonadotropin-releasing hormone II receptor-like [Eublepharis macularius]|uniref:Type II GnRH receptor n=1 Tax=Eublepharis macularius TaxID=481883 RepID=A3DT36_EUBMA|nr:gonadotropin-releasing hormone II receptor-like [Eublepharis macularius]ABB89900.1 type 1/III gonadotropin-releasing hormone receptor [Eublepharis macularius]